MSSRRPAFGEKHRNTPLRTKRSGAPRPAPSLFRPFLGNAKKGPARPDGERKMEWTRSQDNKEGDYAQLFWRALRAIRCANVRFGILPPQSGFPE
jgi:hypothetical protein